MPAILQVENLVKQFGSLTAVNDVSFSIEEGSCFGLLGPNGAGKTTTIEMMEGIKIPNQGSIRYKGQPLGAEFRHQAVIMFQNTALQEFVTVREILTQFSRFYPDTADIDELVKNYAIEDFLDQDTRKLSGGQKQRLLLALALINKPKILFLDEPTTGLDPQSRRNLWKQVQRLGRAAIHAVVGVALNDVVMHNRAEQFGECAANDAIVPPYNLCLKRFQTRQC